MVSVTPVPAAAPGPGGDGCGLKPGPGSVGGGVMPRAGRAALVPPPAAPACVLSLAGSGDVARPRCTTCPDVRVGPTATGAAFAATASMRARACCWAAAISAFRASHDFRRGCRTIAAAGALLPVLLWRAAAAAPCTASSVSHSRPPVSPPASAAAPCPWSSPSSSCSAPASPCCWCVPATFTPCAAAAAPASPTEGAASSTAAAACSRNRTEPETRMGRASGSVCVPPCVPAWDGCPNKGGAAAGGWCEPCSGARGLKPCKRSRGPGGGMEVVRAAGPAVVVMVAATPAAACCATHSARAAGSSEDMAPGARFCSTGGGAHWGEGSVAGTKEHWGSMELGGEVTWGPSSGCPSLPVLPGAQPGPLSLLTAPLVRPAGVRPAAGEPHTSRVLPAGRAASCGCAAAAPADPVAVATGRSASPKDATMRGQESAAA